jgi:ribosomal protein S8
MGQLHNFISTLNLSLKSGNFFFKFQQTKFILQIIHFLIKHQYFIGYKACPERKGYLLIFLKLTVDCKRPLMVACTIVTGCGNPRYYKYNSSCLHADSSLLVLSTSRGLATQKEAHYRRLGGRILLKIV